jgi:hypothetical protein
MTTTEKENQEEGVVQESDRTTRASEALVKAYKTMA